MDNGQGEEREKEDGTAQMIHKGLLEELSNPISFLKMKQTV